MRSPQYLAEWESVTALPLGPSPAMKRRLGLLTPEFRIRSSARPELLVARFLTWQFLARLAKRPSLA